MQTTDIELFQEFTRPMIGLPLSHVWFGYGSSVFLEFGKLSHDHQQRDDGTEGYPQGEFRVMITWGWRLEGRKYILCGCWSDEEKWQPSFDTLAGTTLAGAAMFAQLPELELTFSNGMRCLSFMIDKGHPQWALFDHRDHEPQTLHVHKGRIQYQRPNRSFNSI